MPSDVAELCQFLKMINHLSKFTPYLADKTKPLRDCLSRITNGFGGRPAEILRRYQADSYFQSSTNTFQSQGLYSYIS